MLRKRMTCILFVGAGLFLAHTSAAFTFMVPGYKGAYEIKMQNFDNGTLYASPGVGVAVGGSGDNVADAAALDLIGALPPAGALASGSLPGFTEDTWGIANITEIRAPDTTLLWQQGYLDQNLTAIFYGEVDTYFQETVAGLWHIDGVGLRMDLWEDVGPATAFDPNPGSTGRTGVSSYLTATDGTLVLSAVALPGFLHTAGTHGGPNAEFESLFDSEALTGTGSSFMSVTGGTMAPFFNTDTITTPASQINGVPNADLWLQFTTTPSLVGPFPGASQGNDWLVQSNDPVRGYYIPEPASLGMLGFGLVIMLARRRRR